ncbi:hypothetical protein Tco_0552123 [Tanacetum coccineum]
MINGKMHYLTNDEINEHMEKEELIKKAAEQARLLAITKPKVVKEGEKFKKAQDAELKVLNKERNDNLRKSLALRKHNSSCPLEQASSKSSGRKRKYIELKPEVKVPSLDYDKSLLEGVSCVNNIIIKEPEHGIFFTDVFGDQAFQRWNDIHKVRVDSLVSFLVMALMIKTQENVRFSLKLKKLIAEHHRKEKSKSKTVKLEALGYKLDQVLWL